jgi:hypothetical protein
MVLDRLDAVVFTVGVGKHRPAVCSGLGGARRWALPSIPPATPPGMAPGSYRRPAPGWRSAWYATGEGRAAARAVAGLLGLPGTW